MVTCVLVVVVVVVVDISVAADLVAQQHTLIHDLIVVVQQLSRRPYLLLISNQILSVGVMTCPRYTPVSIARLPCTLVVVIRLVVIIEPFHDAFQPFLNIAIVLAQPLARMCGQVQCQATAHQLGLHGLANTGQTAQHHDRSDEYAAPIEHCEYSDCDAGEGCKLVDFFDVRVADAVYFGQDGGEQVPVSGMVFVCLIEREREREREREVSGFVYVCLLVRREKRER